MSAPLRSPVEVLCPRKKKADDSKSATTVSETDPSIPPTYQIDLNLPPEQRYVKLAQEYASEIKELTSLFRDIVAMTGLSLRWIRFLCRLLLHRLSSSEETAELRGISKAVDVEMYLLIAFNTFLDLFMGCSSGGVKVNDGNGKMLHFRTLDGEWINSGKWW